MEHEFDEKGIVLEEYGDEVTYLKYQPGNGTNYVIVVSDMPYESGRHEFDSVNTKLVSLLWPTKAVYNFSYPGVHYSYIMEKLNVSEVDAKIIQSMLEYVWYT